jgi:hypothetical protein
MIVAVLDNEGKIIAINLHNVNYELKHNEIIATEYAIVGGTFDNGYFYSPKPFSSWTKDGLGNWISPIPKPESNELYVWDEKTISWVKVEV